MRRTILVLALTYSITGFAADDFPKPYSPPCTERENVFEFTEKPAVKMVGQDKYEITFAVRGNCDVTVGIVDEKGFVVRHLGSGVLGANAPAPFQKNSLRQTIYWNGKDDLDEYHKTPEKLKVRVMLGLKPEFDRLLLGMSPHNIPGSVWGLVIGPDGGYVFAKGDHIAVRKFDHDGNYVQSLVPPPANLPVEKLEGMGFVEYERGVRVMHPPDLSTIMDRDYFLPKADGAMSVVSCQPVLIGSRLYYLGREPGWYWATPASVHWFNTDGSTDKIGTAGLPVGKILCRRSFLAASPDGRRIYFVPRCSEDKPEGDPLSIYQFDLDGNKQPRLFVGKGKGEPGSDNEHFAWPCGIDCDGQGRVYVCDMRNNRIQVFSPEGRWLKTIGASNPTLIRFNQKSGAFYVMHEARVEGKTVSRLTKFHSFDDPSEEFHVDGIGASSIAVDTWTAKPRLWVGGGNVCIYEEDGKGLRRVFDFAEKAKSEEGTNFMWAWGASRSDMSKVVCDPVREEVYFELGKRFDLRTGRFVGSITFSGPTDDIAFDKRGYLHAHFNPGFYTPGVGRFAVDRDMVEVPYDYGEDGGKKLIGMIVTRDQPGAKFFQDGIGVNMQGDVAENCNVYYVPKMDDMTHMAWWSGPEGRKASGYAVDSGVYQRYQRELENMKKGQVEVYSIRRTPGVPLYGATVWTFKRNGELWRECAVLAGSILAGCQLDEAGSIYFANCRIRLFNNVPFLAGRGGIYGDTEGKGKMSPLTGVLVKTKPDTQCLALGSAAPIPLEQLPGRPVDAICTGNQAEGNTWYEGAEWIYAGVSPIRSPGGCTCPTQRLHLDWYKRTFVPETYRNSFGILDTAGNLIMHLGRYGNYDSGNGAKSRIPIGGDNIAVLSPRFISGTDNYLCFSDWGERLVALKLGYHAEETVGIGEVMRGK